MSRMKKVTRARYCGFSDVKWVEEEQRFACSVCGKAMNEIWERSVSASYPKLGAKLRELAIARCGIRAG